MRDELYRVCMQQGLGRDAAFVVIAATHIDELDDRGYREAHLGAGLVEGRLHLLAFALGASASGMTFVDTLVPELLEEPLDGVPFTCVGVPEYPTAVGGAPGVPKLIRTVTPEWTTSSGVGSRHLGCGPGKPRLRLSPGATPSSGDQGDLASGVMGGDYGMVVPVMVLAGKRRYGCQRPR